MAGLASSDKVIRCLVATTSSPLDLDGWNWLRATLEVRFSVRGLARPWR